MEQVKKFVNAGATVPGAIKLALDARRQTISGFAAKYELIRQHVSQAINLTEYPSNALLAALAAELGGTADAWAVFMYEAARPAAAVGGAR